jgi:hypothetical protein
MTNDKPETGIDIPAGIRHVTPPRGSSRRGKPATPVNNSKPDDSTVNGRK